VIDFAKVHSLGNDFLIIGREDAAGFPSLGDLARWVCERHTGVGADGLLLITVQDKAQGIVNFRIFNADGTEAEISGNGLRCAAACLYSQRTVATPKIRFRTAAGERESELIEGTDGCYTIKVEMGVPRLASRDIPFDDGSDHARLIDYPLIVNRKPTMVTIISMGNPHCAVFVDRLPDRVEWHRTGREIASHPAFPNRTNVEFVRVHSREEIEVFFWERGVGETLSSGSGACGAAVAAILKDVTGRKVRVKTRLGSLLVEWAGEKEKVYQTGPAEFVFSGTFKK
jgi:diaminopimelate epimerase